MRGPRSLEGTAEPRGTLAVAGAGQADGPPFITLRQNATLHGLCIFYPEQQQKNPPTPYPWTVRGIGDNCSLVDVLLVNPYQAVDFGPFPAGRHWIRGLYAQPLYRGLFFDQCYDVGRVEDVHFWPFWGGWEGDLGKFTREQGIAFTIGRTDWEYLNNCFCIGYRIGYQFLKTKAGAPNAVLTQCGSDIGPTAVRVEGGVDLPKPMVRLGYRPILWHVMKYYAHHGHTHFILCLGYRADLIKRYFLQYDEALYNDFAITGGNNLQLFSEDIKNWRITFVDTGLNSNIGQRLRAVRDLLKGEEMFLANYADGLSDVPIDRMVDDFQRKRLVATFAAVRSSQSFHVVQSAPDGRVEALGPMRDDSLLLNGGFFALRSEIFDYLREGEELVGEPFQRLIEKRLLGTYRHLGFWQAMDTFKDKIGFDRMEARGDCPWMVWRSADGGAPA